MSANTIKCRTCDATMECGTDDGIAWVGRDAEAYCPACVESEIDREVKEAILKAGGHIREVDRFQRLRERGLSAPLAAYRALHPASRAQQWCHLYGSTGGVRRRTCLGCGSRWTSSANWQETVTSRERVAEHTDRCGADYLTELMFPEGC